MDDKVRPCYAAADEAAAVAGTTTTVDWTGSVVSEEANGEAVSLPIRIVASTDDVAVSVSTSPPSPAGSPSSKSKLPKLSLPRAQLPPAAVQRGLDRLADHRRSARENIQQILHEPSQFIQHLRPQAARLSVYVMQRAASFHKKALKASALSTTDEAHMKLGTLTSKDISMFNLLLHLAVMLGPILQIIWTVYVEPDVPEPASNDRPAFIMSIGDAGEATLQAFTVLITLLFVQRSLTHKTRQREQIVLTKIASFGGFISGISLASYFVKASRPTEQQGRQLLSFANSLLAGFLHVIPTYLSHQYSGRVLQSRKDASFMKHEKLDQRRRQLGRISSIAIVLYMVFRLTISWRSQVVFDFIPIANIVTVIRARFLEHKVLLEPHVFLDAVLISGADIALLAVTLCKVHFTEKLFQHVFISDFARVYTEFSVFVVYFCKTFMLIILGGHFAAWAVPFTHFIDPITYSRREIPIVSLGAVQMELGFRFSLALWLIAIMYCALPADSKGIRGWLVGSKNVKGRHQRVKYFLYESDVFIKAFINLTHVGHIDPHHFIMENQVVAFNFAQLVYARGNKQYDQDHNCLQKLVGDPEYVIELIVHDADTDTHCIILSSDSKIVVAFRGTLSKTNAKTDLQSSMVLHTTAMQVDLAKIASVHPRSRVYAAESAIRTSWHTLWCKRSDPKVHSGFYTAYLSVESRVLSQIQELYAADARSILVTGHSLGGALAALCSFDIVARLKITNVTCTTFGCPRLGNHAFKKKYAHTVPATFAIVNASDMITKLPPKTPKAQPYTSVGKTVLVNSFGNLVIEPNVLELDVLHRGYSAKAHTMRAYHLSILLWCLRSHQNKYRPNFWRQSLAFLQVEYGHLPEVRDYLKASVLVNARLQSSLNKSQVFRDLQNEDANESTRLRLVARMLKRALLREREDNADELMVSPLWRLWEHIQPREPHVWFQTNDAIRVLVNIVQLESEDAAIELGQVLTVHGDIKPESVIFGRDGRFFFVAQGGKDAEQDEEEDDDDSEEREEQRSRHEASPGLSSAHGAPPAPTPP